MDDCEDKKDSACTQVTVASKVAFTELCGLLEKISRTSGNEKKKRVLREFMERWRAVHSEVHGQSPNTNDSFYPCMRLLLPHLEKERVAYGIKENMLAKLLIEVLCLGKESVDAMKLLNYKTPKAAHADAGDFASVAYFVLKNRCPERGSLTIADVNNCLDDIATNNTAKKRDLVRNSILHLLKNLSALEQKWLIRMIVKEMKIGLSQASVLGVYHSDAEEFYNVNNNLHKVCVLMLDPSVHIHEIGVSVFSPFTPMLGERGAPDKIEEVMNNKMYYIETKYDGERMLLHKKSSEYKYYSRSGNDYTHVFGGHYLEGTLTPYISNCFRPAVQSCILDAEVVGYDHSTQTFGTKAERFDIKSRDVKENCGYEPCVYVFDILLYNDKVLTNLPLQERLTYLDRVFEPIEGRILRSEHTQAYTNQDCVDALNQAIDGREEGIMVKNPSSVYRPNTRRGGWFKIKPEYIGGLSDELDVLIVGGYFGVGRRSGIMSHFLCAVAVPPTDGNKPHLFYSFCKVGSGYTKKELHDYNQRLVDHWNAFDKTNPPRSIILADGFKEKPDAWIEPSKSFILQIKAAEITVSDRYKYGYTLRFPRVEKVRHDKMWYECMTTADIDDLRQKSGGKLAGQKLELATGEDQPAKKKRRMAARYVKPSVAQQFRGADVSSVQQVSKMLEDKELCVMNGTVSFPKHEIEKKIVEFGGEFVQNPGEGTMCILADKVAIKVKNLIKKNSYDIVKVTWFAACVEEQRWIPWKPADMIHSCPATHTRLQQDYDQQGDSYTQHCTVEGLRRVFDAIPSCDIARLTMREIAEVEDRYFASDHNTFAIFRPCSVYVDNKLVIGDSNYVIQDSPLELISLDLRFHGATVSQHLHEHISHVLVDKSDLSRMPELRKLRRERDKKFHIVTASWVADSLTECGMVQRERDYEPCM